MILFPKQYYNMCRFLFTCQLALAQLFKGHLVCFLVYETEIITPVLKISKRACKRTLQTVVINPAVKNHFSLDSSWDLIHT